MAKKFDISDVFGSMPSVPDSGTNREQLEYIDAGKISGDPNNFYSLTGIEELAANIELIGLQQPIRVRPDPEDEGGYIIVSGHRRFSALAELRKTDPEKWQMVPCIVEYNEEHPAMHELRLIYANADTRKLSSADLDRQAQRVEALLYELKESGYEFPGRMRDYVAQACNVSKTKLSNLKVIREGLASCWEKPYENGTIKEATALVLARMEPELQLKVFEAAKKNDGVRYFYEIEAKHCAEFFEKDAKRTCRGGVICENREGRWQRFVDKRMFEYNSCAGKCCAECAELGACRHSCPKQAERVKQIRADRGEANRQAKFEQEAKDHPKIEKIQRLWYRFGFARQEARKSVKDVLDAAKSYYSKSDDTRYKEFEDLTAKFTTGTTLLPYGYSFSLSDAQRLIAVADCLGCSLDYLFCRTDEPSVAQPQGEGQMVLSCWMPAGTLPPEPCDVVAEFDLDGKPYRQLARFDGDSFAFKSGAGKIDLQPIRWVRLPD